MGSTKSALFVLLASLGGVAWPRASIAADSAGSEGDKIAAQALFEDGRRLVAAGSYAEACPKFAESQRIDPSPSTLLNLASCWEKDGRTASAWVTYREAQSAASALGRRDYAEAAERHANALASGLAHLAVHVAQPVEGIQVRRDGVLMGAPEWGLSIPVDAGAHVVEATAPGYKPWSQTVDVPQDGAQVAVAVPALELLPLEPASGAPSAPAGEAPPALPSSAGAFAAQPGHDGSQRTVGLVVGAAGLVGLGVSGVLAIVASNDHDAAKPYCMGTVCVEPGFSKENDARFDGDAATVAFVAGAAALVAGGVLWLTSPKEKPAATARLVLVASPGGALVEGAW